MSQTKFAAITSGLLARKGDAVPSDVMAKPSLFWWCAHAAPESPPAGRAKAARVRRPPEPGKPHKMAVVLSAEEFEKLGIAAVKKGVTRHQVVRTALDLHLERLKGEYAGCNCMTTGGPCSEGCAIF